MYEVEYVAFDGQTRMLELNTEFVESTRQHVVGEDGPTAYVAPISHVMAEPIETDEICVVVAMPEMHSDGIEYRAPAVTPQVRQRPDGTPVECALLANGQIAVNACALNDAQPLAAGRLTVLWMFRETCVLCHYPYDESTEERFWAASMVADGHRHETNYGAEFADENAHEDNTVEVLQHFMVAAAT
ncbi:hypothetical protein [Paraburkholderia tropica]|uniref:hypothetical protein n=1 Tax=Paraburkholderia tropica TaxID=92647 RepID=UPI002ABE2102|nr:hypothetical protein [Paraburkholderia tropica]